MSSLRRSLLIMIPVLALLGACGGGDDDSDDRGNDPGGDSSTPTTSGDAPGSSNGSANIPAIKDAVFADGEVHVEVSGDKDFKLDLKGNGIATGGYALLTFVNDEASVILAFQADSEEEAGGLSLTHTALATAGEWGGDCTVNLDESGNGLKGEFRCKDIAAVQPGSANTLEVTVKGDFSVTR